MPEPEAAGFGGPMLDYHGPAGRESRAHRGDGVGRVWEFESIGLLWVALSLLIPGATAWAILLGLAWFLG